MKNVFGNARVFGNVRISDNAEVSDNARVFDNAEVSDNAEVFDNAKVFGNAWVSGNAYISGHAHIGKNAYIQSTKDHLVIGPLGSRSDYTTFYLTKEKDIWVCCGCFNDTIDAFEKRVKEVHAGTEYEKEYLDAIFYAKMQFEKFIEEKI